MVSIDKFWIEGVITEAYPQFVKNGGADLDGNGHIEGIETFEDFDGDGYIGSRGDYEIYLHNNRQNNRQVLSAKIPFLKWGERLSVNNRIHQLMYWLSDLHSAALMQSAYTFIADRVEDANGELGPQSLPPEKEALSYYQLMRRAGIVFEDQSDESLVINIDNRQLDCNTSSFVAMAMGDERGVILQGVFTRQHFFLRGKKEDGIEFNIDIGELTSDEEYLSPDHGVATEQVQNKVYLQTLNDQQLESEFLFTRGNVLYDMGKLQEALDAFERAIKIDKNHAKAHYNCGVILKKLGQLSEALVVYERACEIDKSYAKAHNNRGDVLYDLGRYSEALAAFDRAIEINKNYAIAHLNRGLALDKLGRDKEALAAYKKAHELDPDILTVSIRIRLWWDHWSIMPCH